MVVKKLLLCLCVTLCYVHLVFGNPINKGLKLELVQVLFRHGARTPIDCELKMIGNNDDSLYEPYGIAQLTSEGMMEEYRIGQMLRDRYKNFLPDLYKPEDVYAYSSAYDRTKASLQLVLASLYPPKGDFAWNDELDWMPIPIHSNPRALDILMKPRDCPRFIEKVQEFYDTADFTEALEEHKEILQFLENTFGKDFKFDQIICAYNINVVHKNLNLTLPAWYTDDVFEKLFKLTKFYMDTLSYTPALNRLNGGPMVRRFVENMNNHNSKSTNRNIYLYSAHDKNIYSFIKVHNLTLSNMPDYGSTIILEKLRDDRNKLHVKLLLWNGEPKKLTTLKLQNCGEVCPMTEYLKIVNPMLPSNEEMRCLFKNLESDDIESILNTDFSVTSKA